MFDDLVDLTKSRCAADPKLAAIADELLRIEMQGHRAGWDSRYATPAMFRISRKAGNALHLMWCNEFTQLIREKHHTHGRSVGDVLHGLASAGNLARELLGVTDHTNVVGYGIRSEAWMAQQSSASGVMPVDNPDRSEGRMVYFATREGHIWMVIRRRGYTPDVQLITPEDKGTGFGGGIPSGLKRFVEAVLVRPRNPLFR